jgi:hypothetical protein
MNIIINKVFPKTRWRLVGAALIVVAAIGVAGPGIAMGATSTTSHGTSAASDQYHKHRYHKPAKTVAGTSASYKPPVVSSTSSGTLPFTGISLIWPAVAAFALVGLGLALRRHDRKS